MKSTTVFLSLGGGLGAAQVLTVAPVINQLVNAAALNDDDFEICTDLGGILNKCLEDAGGIADMDANPESALGCMCCDGTSAISRDYSSCADYLSDLLTDANVAPFQTLYTMCSARATCDGSLMSSATSAYIRPSTASVIRMTAPEASVTLSWESDFGAPTTTTTHTTSRSTGGPQEVDEDCENMLDMFRSCTNKSPGFAVMPYSSQAACYCCMGRNDAFWTDSLDQYASRCYDWAEESQTGTVWDYAKTFATFCENFSDACINVAAPKTKESTEDATDATTTGSSEEPKGTGSGEDNNDEGNDDEGTASSMIPGSLAGIAIVIGAMLLL